MIVADVKIKLHVFDHLDAPGLKMYSNLRLTFAGNFQFLQKKLNFFWILNKILKVIQIAYVHKIVATHRTSIKILTL
jgi:hypothetical protein